MKINPIPNKNMMQNYKTSRVALPQKGKGESGMDEVSFSEQAISFSKTLAGVKDQFEVRSAEEKARMDEIAEKIRKGEYQVSADEVADKMLRDILSE